MCEDMKLQVFEVTGLVHKREKVIRSKVSQNLVHKVKKKIYSFYAQI